MHELALTQSIVETVAEHAQGRRVRRVTLEIGRLAGVEMDSLRFCFELATEGTALEGAALDIREIEGRVLCKACGREFVQDALYTPCPCGGTRGRAACRRRAARQGIRAGVSVGVHGWMEQIGGRHEQRR